MHWVQPFLVFYYYYHTLELLKLNIHDYRGGESFIIRGIY